MTQPLTLSCAVFVVTGEDAAAIDESRLLTKSQIAFYASTPSYRKVLELHGWADLIPRLNALLMRNRWQEMHNLISDDMLEQFAIIAAPDELPYALARALSRLVGSRWLLLPLRADRPQQTRHLAACGKGDANLMPKIDLEGRNLIYSVRVRQASQAHQPAIRQRWRA